MRPRIILRMLPVTHDPVLSRFPPESFIQSLHLGPPKAPLGFARWHSASSMQGVAQILDFLIDPPHRRQGHGRALMQHLITQCAKYGKLRQTPLRRLWIAVAQKDHIHARAFLISQGFHHVVSLGNLLREQDALVYMRTFD